MTLLRPYEDFMERTLSAFESSWLKLAYFARLRSESGKLSHWGLELIHGEQPARAALQRAHQETFAEVLRTPLPALWKQIKFQPETPPAAIPLPKDISAAWVPQNADATARKHFEALHTALEAMQRRARKRP
jgi:hypothetical protein